MKAKLLTPRLFAVCVAGVVGAVGCAGDQDALSPDTGGGGSGSGGSPVTGTGGNTATGTGGRGGTGTGGGAGGSPVTGSGGSTTTGSGGSTTTGTGGRGGTGGTGTGGTGGAGGRGGTGGGMGGSTGTGGRGGAGGATTGQGGQAGSTTCSLPAPRNGNGSFTYYYFEQGTFREGNGFRTACGYYGTANGTVDTVENIANMSGANPPSSNTYFVAIPGNNGFDSRGNCGACVELVGQNGRHIIATIADECPYGSDGGNVICGANPNGALDVSKTAFDLLGFSRGDPTGTTWSFVPCPVTGNVKVRVKTNNPNELYIENTITAIKSVTMNGQAGSRVAYGAWHWNGNIPAGAQLVMTDIANRTITVTLQGTTQNQNQDVGQQFPRCQ